MKSKDCDLDFVKSSDSQNVNVTMLEILCPVLVKVYLSREVTGLVM